MFHLILLLLILFTGCQKNEDSCRSQALRINIGEDPRTLDPRKARDLVDTTLMRMLFEGLTRISPKGQTELALAEEVEVSSDGLRYRFHLRSTNWSNGDPVTSFDFADSWKAILDPRFPTDVAYQLYPIKNARKVKSGEVGLHQVGIEAPDAQTLIIQLEQPIPYFLNLLATPVFFPTPSKAIKKNPDWALQPADYICNGPFIPTKWVHSDHLRLCKNNNYWQAKEVRIPEMVLFMVSADTEMRMFEAGKLDWVGSPLSTLSVDAVAALKDEDRLRASPFAATFFVRVNTADKLLSSPLFRKALASSLNRQDLTKHVLQGGQMPATSLVPPAMGLSERGYFQDNHPEQAMTFLSDAFLQLDLACDSLPPIKISYRNDPRNALIAQAMQKQWEENLGIFVELEPVESKVYFQRIAKREYQLALGSWTADFDDPITFLEVFKYKNSGTNNTDWENGKYIDLLNASALCRNSEERKELLREAEQILMDQMPVIPLFHLALNYLQSKRLEEIALSPLGQIDFRWATKR